MLTAILKSFGTFVFIATRSSSITLCVTAISLIVILISNSIACGLTICNKVIYEIVMQKYNKYNENMKKTNKQLNILRSYIENVCRIILLIKLNMNV